mgnify:CR=1 FL=1
MKDDLTKAGWEADTELKRTLEWFKLDFEYGEVPEKISVKHSCAEEFTQSDFGEDEFLVTDSRGMSSIALKIAEKLDQHSLKTE